MLKAIQDMYTFRVVRKIAAGGMGSVYEAMQDGIDGFQKTVAVKTLLPQLSESDQFIEMFVHEAKLVADLVHENIVQIYQLGRTPQGYYIVMEYVDGMSLHDFLHFHVIQKVEVPRELAVFIAARVARGLAYAHSREDDDGQLLKIVHRDVCPNNILVTKEGLPKLTDFGIALATARMGDERPKGLMGKLTYMAPEQARNESVDFRADIFSLGAVLFELLSGHPIRRADTQDEFVALAQQGAVDWEHLPASVAPEVRDILERALAPDPNDRYSATADMAHELEYHIYKDGYGPTIQTLEAYMSREFPYLYQKRRKTPATQVRTETIEATVIMA